MVCVAHIDAEAIPIKCLSDNLPSVLFTFITNAVILRYITSDVLGIISVSVPVSAAVSAALAGLWLHALSQPAPEVTSEYRLGVWVTAAMVVLETAAQPLVILAQAMLFVKLKVVADMVSLCSRVALKAWLIALYPSHAIWAYCVGHAVSSALLVVIYYGTLLWLVRSPDNCLPVKSASELGPRLVPGQPALDRDQLALTWSFFKQGLLKQLLTEGERYLMTAFHLLDFSEQGLYDVVANLGSLAARFLFQPVEENAYVYFSRTVERGKPVSAAAGRVLHDLLRAMSLLGLVAVTFGWSYSHLLLRLYGGALLTAGPAVSLLRAQCAYVLLLAMNGVLECYTFAVMRQEQINGYNRKMVLLSVIFVISTGIFTRLFGGFGFILANCVNMLTRIYVCCRFVAGLPLEPAVSVPPLLGLRPPAAVAAALVTAGLLAAGSESWLYPGSAAAHVAVGALCGAAVVAAAVYSEPRLLQAVRERVGDKLKRS
ncbi:Protein RFT1 [Amphibalanus amphitrite]|uniref:Protein RFT1 homolog n=2 Tax=Amphibalanus amphitrite TaxID=1232801 RepID=A0A6A4VLR9_AMPAM|nr:Protein RFT1 [Amphibalanus amphitrite]KAF0294573.1 Protein RFT1 [Amphibalanus amphitrite]